MAKKNDYLPNEATSAYLDAATGVFRFSDGIIMPYRKYQEYVDEELNGELPTEPREYSEAVFRARARWEQKHDEQKTQSKKA